MEPVLLVGEVSGTAEATLADRGYAVRRVDEEHLLADGEGVDGEVADGEVADGEGSGGEVADGEVADGEGSGGEVADGEGSGGGGADGEGADGEGADGEGADGEGADGEGPDGEGAIDEAGADGTGAAGQGSTGDRERKIHESARDATAAIVAPSDGSLDAIRALGTAAPELPILYAIDVDDSAAAGPALAAGADDRVLLDGERSGDRIASRLDGLLDTTGRSDGASVPAASDLASAPATPDRGDGARDDRIGRLLEGARDLMDANTPDEVATVVVRTANRVLGYDAVGVKLVEDDGETVRLAAATERAEAMYEETGATVAGDTVVRPAIERGDTLELDASDLTNVASDRLRSALLFPLGSHGVLSIGSEDPDAFGRADRHVGELLAANARTALDRIDRVERIEAIHGATREMLDARRPVQAADRAVDAARSVLDYRFVVCFLTDDETGRLEPVAWTDEAETLTGGDIPRPEEGDGAVEAFERGTIVRRDGHDSGAAGGLPGTSRLHVPIEDHGTVLVATTGGDGFDESDVQLARVLATNTARALDRVDRTQELHRLETVFETVDDMVFVQDETGKFLHCTPVLAERLGYDREELIGANVMEFVDEEAATEGQRLIEALLGDPPGSSRTQRLELETADGESVPVEIDYSLLPGEEYRGVVGAVRDVSDILAVRERLDAQQARFEYLFENIPDPVVEGYIDDEAVIDSVNPAFEETFGFEEEEIEGELLNDVIVPADMRERARALDRRSAAGKLEHAEVERATEFGLREFLFRGVPYETSDGRLRCFGIYTDITEQKERQRHLEVLQRLLRHNVRNDVNVLLAGIDQLEETLDGGDERAAELLETLEDSAGALLSMSTKAKRISRVIDAETEELGVVDLATIAGSVAEDVDRFDADATVELDAPDRCRVHGSAAIERAVEELLGNAIQHAGDSPTITLSIDCGADRGSLTVADDGPGIPDAERDVLQDEEITPLKHGSGLGLWLVTHATEASGGTVSFDDGDGARVTLSFRRPMDDE